MTTPAKATPAKAAKKTVAPALDFSALTATEAVAPQRKSDNGVDVRKTPVYGWVRDSWNAKTAVANSNGQPVYRGKGLQVIVPTANAGQMESLIRKAAQLLGADLGERIGAAIATEELSGKDKGKSAVRFCAKTGKAPYTRTPKTTAKPTPTPAA